MRLRPAIGRKPSAQPVVPAVILYSDYDRVDIVYADERRFVLGLPITRSIN